MSFWHLDPTIVHLNHGSFGACPQPVLDAQHRWQLELETNPVRFVEERRQPALDAARSRLAEFLGTSPGTLAFVENATTGVNTVLANLGLGPGDELVTTDHEYNACRNALEAVASRTGARVVVAPIRFPEADPEQAYRSVVSAVGERTRLVLIDHVTSPTALVLPVERIVAELEPTIPVLVDGAHAPGMVPLDLDRLGASFYAGNLHKWVCAPKGAAFLAVRPDRQEGFRPLVISHGWNAPPSDRSRFHTLFDWTGTTDPSAWLAVPNALEEMAALRPGGWQEVMESNHRLVLAGRDVISEGLGVPPAAPDEMIGSMAAIPLSPGTGDAPPAVVDPLTHRIRARGFETVVFVWPAWPARLIRVSAQQYNTLDQYQRLAEVLEEELGSPR